MMLSNFQCFTEIMITKLTSLVKMAEAWNTSHTLVQPDGGKFLLMTALAGKLADKRVIYFGESHEQPEGMKCSCYCIES